MFNQPQNPLLQYSQIRDHAVKDINKNRPKTQQNGVNQVLNAQLDALSKVYKIERVHQEYPISPGQVVVNLTLQFKDMPLKIVVESTFPLSGPKVYLRRKFHHAFIDKETWEVNLQKMMPSWNPGQTLQGVIDTVSREFQKISPYLDESITLLKEQLSQSNPSNEIGLLIGKSLEDLFPNYGDKIKGISINQDFSSQIMQQPEYSKLAKIILMLMEINKQLSEQVKAKNENLERLKEQLQQQVLICEGNQGMVATSFQKCEMIKERFEKTKILSMMEYMIAAIQESSVELEQINKDFKREHKGEYKLFIANCKNYQKLRQEYHFLVTLKEKLEVEL